MERVGAEWAVLTWNIQGTKRTDLERAAAIIAHERVAVVALQEARRPQTEQLAADLGMNHVWHEKHHPLRPLFPGRAEGAAILSPHTVRDVGHRRVSDAASMRSYRRRIVQWAVVQRADSSAYRVFNTHLSPHDMADERLAEATRITALAAALGDSPPSVVAGDLNDAGAPEIIAALPGIEVLTPPPTNPSKHPTERIDHVLVPPDASDVSVSVPAGGPDWAALSDHLPMTVRFALDWVQGGFAG